MKTLVWIFIAALAFAAVSTAAGVWLKRRPEITAAMRGKRIAESLGCFACHGPEGQGGVADPTSPGGEVPDWQYATVKMFIQSEQDLREWILCGAPERELQRQRYNDRPVIVPMPAYEEFLSNRELNDLVAYFLAVSGWRPQIPDTAYEGRKIAERLGCFGCHGPSGMGGVANPGSLKGHIPPWDGKEFDELVRDEQELRDWIHDGQIDRLWNNPAARFFLDRQKTPMPAYHDHLSDAELDMLVDYIQWLRSDSRLDGKQQRDAATVIATQTGVN